VTRSLGPHNLSSLTVSATRPAYPERVIIVFDAEQIRLGPAGPFQRLERHGGAGGPMGWRTGRRARTAKLGQVGHS
jgi:hypothetical protein